MTIFAKFYAKKEHTTHTIRRQDKEETTDDFYADSIFRGVEESVFLPTAGDPLSCVCLLEATPEEATETLSPPTPLDGGTEDDEGTPGFDSTTTAAGA